MHFIIFLNSINDNRFKTMYGDLNLNAGDISGDDIKKQYDCAVFAWGIINVITESSQVHE